MIKSEESTSAQRWMKAIFTGLFVGAWWVLSSHAELRSIVSRSRAGRHAFLLEARELMGVSLVGV